MALKSSPRLFSGVGAIHIIDIYEKSPGNGCFQTLDPYFHTRNDLFQGLPWSDPVLPLFRSYELEFDHIDLGYS
jgi:hypothetical protein